MVLALYLEDIEFTKEFIQHCGSSIDMLKSLAKDCSTGSFLVIHPNMPKRLLIGMLRY